MGPNGNEKDCSKCKITERYALIPGIWQKKITFTEGETTLRSLKMGQLGKIIAGKLVLTHYKRALATRNEWKIRTD